MCFHGYRDVDPTAGAVCDQLQKVCVCVCARGEREGGGIEGSPIYHQPATQYFIISIIIESVDSISRDERDVPLTQYITNA